MIESDHCRCGSMKNLPEMIESSSAISGRPQSAGFSCLQLIADGDNDKIGMHVKVVGGVKGGGPREAGGAPGLHLYANISLGQESSRLK